MNRKLSEKTRRLITGLAKSGLSQRAIAKEVGCNQATVARFLQANGTTKGIAKQRAVKSRITTPVVKQSQVIALAMVGESQSEIARRIGLARETVAKILSQSEINEEVERAKSLIIHQAQPLTRMLLALGLAGDRQAIVDALSGIGVLVPRKNLAVAHQGQVDLLHRRANEELDFFLKHGAWPEEVDPKKPPVS